MENKIYYYDVFLSPWENEIEYVPVKVTSALFDIKPDYLNSWPDNYHLGVF